VKYVTRGRDTDDDILVVPNHGAFLGLMVEIGDGFETSCSAGGPITRIPAPTTQRDNNKPDGPQEFTIYHVYDRI
jgi:hypothetical protein